MSLSRVLNVSAAVLGPLCFAAVHFGWLPDALMVLQFVLIASVVVGIANGADWLVDSACRIAESVGVSHLVIGLTIVAFGTSAPEIAASLLAGFGGKGDIAVANVVGSNVFNICFILGGVAALLPGGLTINRALLRRDTPVLLLGTTLVFLFVGGLPGTLAPTASAGFWPELLNLRMERAEGLILVVVLVSYLTTLYRTGGDGGEGEEQDEEEEEESFGDATPADIPLFLVGLVFVVGGCHLLVGDVNEVDGQISGYGALWFARIWGVPDHVVGITIIAAGTSAPELVVSFVAAARGAFGLSAGNLVGSDIFNFYGVLGLAGLLLQQPAAAPVMLSPGLITGVAAPIGVVILTLLFMRSGRRVSRVEGGTLVALGLLRWGVDILTL